MGNHDSKGGKESNLRHEERRHVSEYFKSFCQRNKDLCHKEFLEESWKTQMDKNLCAIFMKQLFGGDPTISFEPFLLLFSSLARSSPKTTTDYMIALMHVGGPHVPPTYDNVLEYVKSIISSYIICLGGSDHVILKSWAVLGFKTSSETCALFAKSLCQYLQGKNIEEYMEKWYSDCSEFQRLQVSFMCYLCHIPQDEIMFGTVKAELSLFPLCQGLAMNQRVLGSILKLPEVLFLNMALPPDLRLQWRFTFSTLLHGESFSTFLSHVTHRGPTLIIVMDKDGYSFGGFASENWFPGPSFRGDDRSFLFTLSPSMKIFESTGYNNHFQYLNHQQQTLPNGLGMGGQFNYFGLWIDSDFGKGHCSESCTTYKNYQMLSKKKFFVIHHMEVWGVGAEYVGSESEREVGSVRNKELEAKAILQMSGRKMYSEDIQDN